MPISLPSLRPESFILVMRPIILATAGGQKGDNNKIKRIKFHRLRGCQSTYLPITVPTERPFLSVVRSCTKGGGGFVRSDNNNDDRDRDRDRDGDDYNLSEIGNDRNKYK